MNKSKIIVIGSAGVDLTVKLERLPKPGETIVGGTFSKAYGAKGANQAVAAARLGGNVTFVANMGADDYRKESIINFQNEGMNTEFITADNEYPTAVAFIFVDKKGENAIGVASGANMNLSVKDVEKAKGVIADHNVMLLQLETPVETNRYSARLGKEFGIMVILNPAPAFPLDEDLLRMIDVLTPNETEAEILTGIKVIDESSAKQAADMLRKKGAANVIITMGAQGAFLLTDVHSGMISSIKIDAVDTTAAGDAFNGALAFALSNGESLKDAVKFANMAGAFAATKLGAQPSMSNREELRKFAGV
ncbi:ribokinase [bacterium]|nr:ribokinase [bacterium]